MLRATADTNIHVSALAIGGKPMELLQLVNSKQIELAVSDAILDKIARVLARPKFGWSPERIAEARETISKLARHVTPTQSLDVVKHDPADNKILECAAEAGSDYIISGDKHLLRLKRYGNAPILKVSDFLHNGCPVSGISRQLPIPRGWLPRSCRSTCQLPGPKGLRS